MTIKRKIVICDDSSDAGGAYKKRLEKLDVVQKNFEEPRLVNKDELEQAVQQLENRLKLASTGEISNYPSDDEEANIIDDAALLVIDYALLDLNSSATGERIAYLARCYSKCGFIVALNQFPPYVDETFDLTLRGHLESYADLNIPSDSLSNPGLWSETWDGFRPWNWPLLPDAIDRLEHRVDELRGNLDKKILEFFDFKGTKALTLPRSTIEFLSREKPEETIFQDFVDNEGSGNGLRGRKERPINDEAVARIAAARISSWLENAILPSQNILVDAPHLISRYPSLLGDKANDIDTWNRTASFLKPDKLGLNQIIEPAYFQRNYWLSRPAWFWVDLSNNEGIEEVRSPWTATMPDFVFAEDISRFVQSAEARSFVADLESPFVRRHVKYLEGQILYTPTVRFSL